MADHLVRSGAHILARNFACPLGELDIVANQEGVITFIEVKSRVGESGLFQALSARQILRLKKMAVVFLQHTRLWPCSYCFWVYYVIFRGQDDTTPRMIRIEDPFQ